MWHTMLQFKNTGIDLYVLKWNNLQNILNTKASHRIISVVYHFQQKIPIILIYKYSV